MTHQARAARGIVAALVVAGGIVAATGSSHGAAAAPSPVLKWRRDFPNAVVRLSSPTPVNLDGQNDVMFGSQSNGNVYALHGGDGSDVPGWPQHLSNGVDGSPSAADVNGDGQPEVFVGAGIAASPGGAMYSFNRDGSQRFRFNGSDPDSPSQAMQSTPALGDINRDGVADATFGALGLTMPSLNRDGVMNAGWPFYSDDTVFSSPALADINGDGQTDVIVGGDASPGGPVDHRGGMLRALNGDGRLLWQYFTDEIVFSSPAVGDIDGDGQPEIVFGTGEYWSQNGGSADCNKVFVLNRDGSLKWVRDTGEHTLSSPALADVNGDGKLDVVEGTAGNNAGKVWAWDGAGNNLAGFPVASPGGSIIGSITTADLNGDGAQDLLVPTGGGVFFLNGRNGAQLFNGIEQGVAAFQNSPLVTDIDGNGKLDVIVVGTTPNNTAIVRDYELPAGFNGAAGALGWPMFHKDARHTGSWTNPPLVQNLCTTPGGYWLVARDGGIFAFCDARFQGSAGNIRLNQPIVGMAPTPNGGGYWLVASDGGIFAYGNAAFQGSAGAIRLNQPIVGMARTPSGNGYWLVASDGGIFAYGDAVFQGSAGNLRLNQPIVGMAPTPTGHGYWLVARDGGIFAYGDAVFHGSTGAMRLNQPIVGMTAKPDGAGYWMVAADGGIFAFDAPFVGSTGNIRLNQPIVGMSRTPNGDGYWLVASDGGIFAFNAPFVGSTGSMRLNQPIVGMSAPGA